MSGASLNAENLRLAELCDGYALKLARLAERHLCARLRTKLDGEDVVQSVFRTFFRRRQESAQPAALTESSLWPLLLQITVCKARAKARGHSAQKRAFTAEVPFTPDEIQALQREPNTADLAEFEDLCAAVTRALPAHHAQILELRLAGYTNEEIAGEMQVTRASIQRSLHTLRRRMQQLLADANGQPGESS